MKILHMISGGDTGGAKTHVFALMNALTKYCDVKIVCFIKGQFFDELQDIDVPSELIEQKNRFDLSVIDRLCEICKNDGIQIIHAHGARANFIASRLKKRIKLPVVTTVHSDYLLDFDGVYKKILYTALNVRALKKLDYYVAVSSNFKDMLISRGFRPNSIFTVYNGMDYSKPMTYCSKEEFAQRIGIEYNPSLTYVGIIGRHDFVKGHDVFLKGAAEVLKHRKDVHFVIAGDGDGRGELVRLANELGILQNLTFAGFIKDIYSFINFTDINTLTSRCESFPYVLMEAARLSKPTVSSAVGGIPDLIEEGVTGRLFESENSTDLAEKLLSLIDNKDYAEKLGHALYERATGTFSNENLAKNHFDIYNAILRDSKDKKQYDAVISGYYGFGNSGDDALLLGMTESLRALMPDIRLVVLSKNAHETKKVYRIDALKRFNPFSVHMAMNSSHMLISGGGSLIQDATSFKSLIYYLYILHLAEKKGLRTMLYANGIGPLKDKNIETAAKVLRKTDLITLRDPDSLDLLSRMNIENVPVHVLSDPALILNPPSESKTRRLLSSEGIPENTPYMCVSGRPWQYNDKDFVSKLAKICDEVYEKHGIVSVMLPMKPSSDKKLSLALSQATKHKSYVINKNCDVLETMGIVSGAKLIIGMRLHILIYALTTAVPCIGLSYDPKIDGFLKYIGGEYLSSVSDINEKEIISYISEIVEKHGEISEKLLEIRTEMRKKARENAHLAISLLNEKDKD